MKMTRFFTLSVLAIALAACGKQTSEAPKNPTENPAQAVSAAADSSKVWRVAVEPIYPPYVMPNETKSHFMGYDIDVLNAIAARENTTVVFTPYPWNGLFARLDAGEADIVAGGLSPNEERKASMDFTLPYDETNIVLAVPQDSTIKQFADAKGKHVVYQKDSSDAKIWEKLHGATLQTPHATDSAWLSFRTVMKGADRQADAALGHLAVFAYYLKQYPDANVKLIENPNHASREPMAFAVKKGNQALLDVLNKHLTAMQADGSLKKLHDQWVVHEHHAEHKHDEHKH